jgi:hypothetical protein
MMRLDPLLETGLFSHKLFRGRLPSLVVFDWPLLVSVYPGLHLFSLLAPTSYACRGC